MNQNIKVIEDMRQVSAKLPYGTLVMGDEFDSKHDLALGIRVDYDRTGEYDISLMLMSSEECSYGPRFVPVNSSFYEYLQEQSNIAKYMEHPVNMGDIFRGEFDHELGSLEEMLRFKAAYWIVQFVAANFNVMLELKAGPERGDIYGSATCSSRRTGSWHKFGLEWDTALSAFTMDQIDEWFGLTTEA